MEDESPQEGLQKFIQLMRNLTQLILEDSTHQQTIYECLNSQEIKRLFESIHDEDQQLRMTAIKFVCHLLHDNSHILERLGMMDGCSLGVGIRKYVVGGLDYYKQSGYDVKRKFIVKQPEIILAFNKLKYQPHLLAWGLDLKTLKLNYLPHPKHSSTPSEHFPFDPKHYIVGLFVKSDEGQSVNEREKRASISSMGERGKYKISKK